MVDPAARRALWGTGATVVLALPVVLAARRVGVEEPGRTLSVALGTLALVTLGVAVLAPSRLRSLTAAFGMDRVIAVHRLLGIAAVAATLAHVFVAIVRAPRGSSGSTATHIGWVATIALIAAVAAAAARRRGRYEVWFRVHVGMAAAALVLAGLHVYWLGGLVTDPVMRVVLSVLALGLLAVLFGRWVWRPLLSPRGAYAVYGVRRECATVATLVLMPVHLRRGLRFRPGQFVWLRLGRSAAACQEHPFTIASSAQVTGRLELTVRGSGDFSTALAHLPVGTKVWLDGPHGSFTADLVADVDPDTEGLVLVAGGVGITPMMSMLRTLAERGDRRPHRLVIAQRPDERLFADEIAALSRRLDLRVTRTEGRRMDAALLGGALPTGRRRCRLDYFVCGSASLVTGTLAALEQVGIPAERIRSEQFGGAGTPVRHRQPHR